MPWWGAVLLAFGLAALGAVADLQVSGSLNWLFQGCYLVGSVVAVGAVRRRSLFGPMVQPPLILAITVPTVVLMGSGLPASSDMLSKALAISTPLINGFPTMAITTGITVAIGVYRMFRERDPDAPRKAPAKDKRTDDKPSAGGAPRAGVRDAKGAKTAKNKDDAGGRERPAKKRPAEGRGEAPPRRAAPEAAPPDAPRRGAAPPAGAAGRRGRPDESGRRGRERPAERDPGAAGDAAPRNPDRRTPRRPRTPPPGEPARGRDEDRPERPPGPKRPRRTPPRSDEPPPGRPDSPRRDPSRGPRPPRRSRPWDEER